MRLLGLFEFGLTARRLLPSVDTETCACWFDIHTRTGREYLANWIKCREMLRPAFKYFEWF